MRQLSLSIMACFALGVLPRCAPVHDATPANCPAGQQASGALCVCISTQAPPVEGSCTSTTPGDGGAKCSVDDCEDDGNPCTKPTCTTDASSCSNEPVAEPTSCDLDGAAGTCVSGTCVVEPPPEWELGTPFVIGGEGGEILSPQIAVDALGNAIAVWSEDEALVACRFDSVDGWSEPETIEEQFDPDRGLSIDMDASGNAIVVYARIEQGSIDIRARRFDSTIGVWGAPDVLSRNGAVASAPRIAITSQGEVIAAWWEAPGAIMLARTATDRLTWDAPVVISPDDGFAKGNPHLSLADNGKGAIIYSGGGATGPAETVWVQAIDAGIAPAVAVDASNAEVKSTRIAAAADGALMAVWEQQDDLWHAHSVDGQWSEATRLETAADPVGTPEVVAAGEGVFFAAWPQSNTIRARRFMNDAGWGDTTTPRTDGTTRPPSLLASSSGDAWILWHESDSIILRSFTPDSGWGDLEKISLDIDVVAPSSNRPDCDRAPDGTLIAVWGDGTSVYAWADAR